LAEGEELETNLLRRPFQIPSEDRPRLWRMLKAMMWPISALPKKGNWVRSRCRYDPGQESDRTKMPRRWPPGIRQLISIRATKLVWSSTSRDGPVVPRCANNFGNDFNNEPQSELPVAYLFAALTLVAPLLRDFGYASLFRSLLRHPEFLWRPD